MNPDLLRQRRNLIAISAVLLVFDFANVKITKVSVLGTELVGNAQVLMACAWILWGYFLLRYFQYWWIEPGQPIRKSFEKKFYEYARLFSEAEPVSDGKGGFFDNYVIRRDGRKWFHVIQVYSGTKDRWKDGPKTSIPIWRMAVWAVKTLAFLCLQTPHVTDHILPFVLAFSAPVVHIYHKWHPILLIPAW